MLTDDGTFDGGLRTVATHAPAGTVGRDGGAACHGRPTGHVAVVRN